MCRAHGVYVCISPFCHRYRSLFHPHVECAVPTVCIYVYEKKCMCISVYMHVCIYVCTYTYIRWNVPYPQYVHMHETMYVYISAHACMHTHIFDGMCRALSSTHFPPQKKTNLKKSYATVSYLVMFSYSNMKRKKDIKTKKSVQR